MTTDTKSSKQRVKIRPWQVVLTLLLAYLAIVFIINDFDSDVFIRTGEWYPRCEAEREEDCDYGYDGQFSYYIIICEWHDDGDCPEVPAYRYQRVLLAGLGNVAYLLTGSKDILPYVFVLINLMALVGSTALMEQLLVAMGTSRWFALVYGLFFGVVIGVVISTSEPLAYGLVVLAIWLGQRERPRLWFQAIVLALAMLAKETVGPFVAGFVMYYALQQRWKDALRVGAVAGIPFILWQTLLYTQLGEFGVGSGGGGATPFEIIPYNGVWRIWTDGNLLAFLVIGTLVIPSVVLPSAWGIWSTLKELWRKRTDIHLYTALLLWNAGIMPFIPFSTYREYLGIFRLSVGLVMMHVLYTSLRYKGRRVQTYSILWLILLIMLVFLTEA
jgi:hypothetical protein